MSDVEPSPTATSSKFGPWQIASVVLAVLLVGALFFGFTKNSALSDSKSTVAAQSEQIDTLTSDLEDAQAVQGDLDSANAQLAACSAAVADGDAGLVQAYDILDWAVTTSDTRSYDTMKSNLEAAANQFLTDAAVCDPANYSDAG